MIVYENYSKFLRATDNISNLKTCLEESEIEGNSPELDRR